MMYLLMFLLKNNIDSFVFDRNGQSPLHIVSENGYLDLLTKICIYSISKKDSNDWKSSIPIFDHTDNKGRTLLHLFAAKRF